jgi:hypothetical protein
VVKKFSDDRTNTVLTVLGLRYGKQKALHWEVEGAPLNDLKAPPLGRSESTILGRFEGTPGVWMVLQLGLPGGLLTGTA